MINTVQEKVIIKKKRGGGNSVRCHYVFKCKILVLHILQFVFYDR